MVRLEPICPCASLSAISDPRPAGAVTRRGARGSGSAPHAGPVRRHSVPTLEIPQHTAPHTSGAVSHLYHRAVVPSYLLWMFLRSTLHRGYVLCSSLYFVTVAHLSASQIVLLGVGMSVTLLFTDIPAGAWADAFGRRRSLVLGQVLLAVSMLVTGLVRTFPLLLVTQVAWGLGWAFLNGIDTAWVTDELEEGVRIAPVLTAGSRRDLMGGATGMVALGLLGWAVSLSTALVVSGVGMFVLAAFVALRFVEHRLVPGRLHRWHATALVRRGAGVTRRDHEVLIVITATFLVNAALMVGWLYPKRLVALGFPNNPILWYSALLVVTSFIGFLAMHYVERHIEGTGVARRFYALACLVGVLGLVVLATVPTALLAATGVLLARGITDSVTRPISVIWVNRRVTSDVRATVHSFLSQAESVGEIAGGLVLAVVARVAGMPVTFATAAALVAVTGMLVLRSRADREGSTP